MLYRTMQPEYKPAEYLSVIKCASNRRLISRFRTGWHGLADLQVDTDRGADGVHLDRTDRLCLACKSLHCVEDEQHLVFDCPAYSHTRSQLLLQMLHVNLLQHCCTIADFITLCDMVVTVSLGNALHVGGKSCLYEFTELKFLSVGSQLHPRTSNILID